MLEFVRLSKEKDRFNIPMVEIWGSHYPQNIAKEIAHQIEVILSDKPQHREFYQIMISADPRDQIIKRLVGSLATHPAFAIMSSDLIYELHAENWEGWRDAERSELPEMKWR